MNKILVIGSSGFVGGHVARALVAEGYAVRCLARNPAKVRDLAALGCEVVQGDISDLASMQRALEGVDAAYIAVHTLSPQGADTAGKGFMDVEMQGLQNIVAACRAHGVRRLVYVTFLGAAPDGASAWIRGRWQTEQFLLHSGLDVTVIRPGMIVGMGGQGFAMTVRNARRRVSIVIGGGQQRFRPIAIDDLVAYLVGVLDDPRAYGHCYDVGSDDVLTTDQMVDVAAALLGRQQPGKIHIPQALLGALAPLIERTTKTPQGPVGLCGGDREARTFRLWIGRAGVRLVRRRIRNSPHGDAVSPQIHGEFGHHRTTQQNRSSGASGCWRRSAATRRTSIRRRSAPHKGRPAGGAGGSVQRAGISWEAPSGRRMTNWRSPSL